MEQGDEIGVGCERVPWHCVHRPRYHPRRRDDFIAQQAEPAESRSRGRAERARALPPQSLDGHPLRAWRYAGDDSLELAGVLFLHFFNALVRAEERVLR